MELLLHQFLAGLATGGIYACMALAIVMIYQAIDHLNFAQGEMAMFSTFIAWQFIQWGFPYWLAFPATIVVSFVAGVAIERIVFKPIHDAPVLSHIVVFIALFAILNSLAGFIWDYNVKNFPSPFGSRRYYGRSTGGGFHNGIDYEGKIGESIYAAADGVINHQGWYFNYGRTVKISHADNFETLYAHMSRFADGVGPGSQVRKGDLIGYVGSSGRSTGAHLHFSVIVNGQFVDPAPYVSEKGGNSVLAGETLVVFRQWQQELRKAASGAENGNRPFRFLQGAEPWTRNPFQSSSLDRL